MKYILASASPRRKELLSMVVSDFAVCPSNIPEIVPQDLPVEQHPEYLARLKAEDIANNYPDDIVIGADTSVIFGDVILGKPKDREDARRMLKILSGNTHKVITGCAVVKNDICESFSVVTEVEFFELSNTEISEYLDTNEPYDKAGSYAIQGLGGLFVKAINGDYFNVVGLPIAYLKRFMNK